LQEGQELLLFSATGCLGGRGEGGREQGGSGEFSAERTYSTAALSSLLEIAESSRQQWRIRSTFDRKIVTGGSGAGFSKLSLDAEELEELEDCDTGLRDSAGGV